MKMVKALLLDLGGVLYEGDHPIPGGAAAVEAARRRGLILRFVTNTATEPAEALIAKLAAMGIAVEADELITAPQAARRYIRHHGLRPYLLVHPAIEPLFADLPRNDPSCVLLGDAREGLCYRALNEAFRLCRQGVPLIGLGMNRYFHDGEGLSLDAGPFIRALEWAADTSALIIGKPSRAFFDEVVATTGCCAEACLMVGDDADADVIGAIDAGLQGCLVRSGKYHPGDEARLPRTARVVDRLADLIAG